MYSEKKDIKEIAEKIFKSVKIKNKKIEERPKPEKFEISPSKKVKPNQ